MRKRQISQVLRKPFAQLKHFQLEIAERKDRAKKTSQTTKENSASFLLTFISLTQN